MASGRPGSSNVTLRASCGFPSRATPPPVLIASGSLIGMLFGVLGGPIGMLLGWGVGAATGALYDAERLDTGDEAIAAFGRLIPPGGTRSSP